MKKKKIILALKDACCRSCVVMWLPEDWASAKRKGGEKGVSGTRFRTSTDVHRAHLLDLTRLGDSGSFSSAGRSLLLSLDQERVTMDKTGSD